MGIFSDKVKVKVNVTVQQLFESSQIPDSARQGIIKGILNDGSIVDYMTEELAGSISIRANSAVNWAKNKDYYFGVPTSHIKSNIDAKTVVLSTISNNVGQAITPDYYTMGPMNSFHYGWTWLVNVHGYSPNTNELVGLSASTGKKCYLADMRATYTQESFEFMQQTYDMGMVDQLGPPPTSGYTPSKPFTALSTIGAYDKQPAYEVSSVAVEDYVTITYEFEEAPGIFIKRGLTLPLTGIDLTADFHQCRYRKKDGNVGFFTYKQGSGTYPLIDVVFSMQFNDLGTYYPWIYFRINDQRVRDMFDLKAYEDANKFADRLGINYRILDDKVHEDPNVQDVQQSMVMMGLNPGDTTPDCIEYLFNQFSILHANTLPPAKKANDLEEQFYAFTSSPSQLYVVQDKFFSMNFQYSGIAKQRKPGVIGVVGTYKSEYAVVGQNDQSFLTNGPLGVGRAKVSNGQPAWIYRCQVSDSMFEEVAVYGLRANYNVHRKKGFGAGATAAELLIPINKDILKTLGLRKREQVMCRSIHFFVSTAVEIRTPWYASSVFKVVMLIVAVVITIFSAGAAWQSIVAAAALGASALAITVLTYIVTTLAIQYGIKLFVKVAGPQLGIIAAIAAAAVGAYGMSTNATWGESLVGIASNLASTSQEAIQSDIMAIINGIEDFQNMAKGAYDSLSDKKEMLGLDGQNVGLEPLEMVYRTPEIRFGESPNDLYNRTVHSGNIGVTSYDMIEFYVSSKLTLPKLSDTQMMEIDEDGMVI